MELIPSKDLTDVQAKIKAMADKIAEKQKKPNQSTDKSKEKRIKAKQP